MSRRVLLIPLRSRASRLLVAAFTVAGAAWIATGLVGRAVAESLASKASTVTELEQAAAWDPQNPELHRRLAGAYQARLDGPEPERARLHMETALRQRPTHGLTWLQFASLADHQGDRARASDALGVAMRADPHNVVLRWEAALLALRWDARTEALDYLRYVITADPGRRDVAFQLATTLLAPGEALASLLPGDSEALTTILETAIARRDVTLARTAWERRQPLDPPMPAGLPRRYIELLLAAGEADAAHRAWVATAPDGQSGVRGNVVWNGGFEAPTLKGWGFDWRAERVWGVEVGLDRAAAAEGGQSLRLKFNSAPGLDFRGVVQTVAVGPGAYALRARARSADFTTQSGLKLQVVMRDSSRVLGETGPIAGTTADWVVLEGRVRIPPGVRLVQLWLRREPAGLPEAQLSGKVWVDDVVLVSQKSGT